MKLLITPEQLLQNRSITEPTVATLILGVPWNETSFGNIQRILADSVENQVFDNVDILDYEPVNFDWDKQTFQIKYTLGVVDLLETVETEA
jgi:hypothetical protein